MLFHVLPVKTLALEICLRNWNHFPAVSLKLGMYHSLQLILICHITVITVIRMTMFMVLSS